MKNDYKSIPFTLAADVANAATFDISYPAGYNAGDFADSLGHHLILGGDRLDQPQNIALSFGASTVTVTNGTGGTLLAGTKGVAQLEIRSRALALPIRVPGLKGMQLPHLEQGFAVYMDLGAPKTLDADGLVAAIAAGATAGSFAVSDMVAATANGGILDVPRNVTVQGDGAGANQVVTIVGYDEYGAPMQETITASGATIVQGVKAFKQVVSGSWPAGGNAAHTLNIGWGDVLGLPIHIKDKAHIKSEYIDGVETRCDYLPLGYQSTGAEVDAATSRYLYPGFAGEVISAQNVNEGATTTGGDITYTVGAAAITGLTNTVANGDAAGVVYTDTPTGDGTEYFLSTDYLKVAYAAAFDGSASQRGQIMVRRSNGRTVVGLDKNTKATATNADTRGTFKPNTATNGTHRYVLLAIVGDVAAGNQQYNG